MRLRIGAIEYAVVRVKGLSVDDEPADGCLAYLECAIQLEATTAPQLSRVTLWHEILHAILAHSGRQLDHDEDEIEALAHGIVQVLRDNPELTLL